jgi:heterodisulfide reductase subunit A-like polyferredoxin
MNYLLRALDTSPEIEELQISLFRNMSEEERQMRAAELIRSCRELQEQGIRERHPEYSGDEVRVAAIRMRLDEALFREAYPEYLHVLP